VLIGILFACEEALSAAQCAFDLLYIINNLLSTLSKLPVQGLQPASGDSVTPQIVFSKSEAGPLSKLPVLTTCTAISGIPSQIRHSKGKLTSYLETKTKQLENITKHVATALKVPNPKQPPLPPPRLRGHAPYTMVSATRLIEF
jgi:hypothetical protein